MRLITALLVSAIAFGLVKRDHGTWKDYLCAAILSVVVCIGILLV